MKKYYIGLLLILVFPLSVLAYSNKIAVGGETIGIEVHSKGVYVVGFYEVEGKKIGEMAGFKIGDIIKKVDSIDISSIEELNQALLTAGEYNFLIVRDGQNINISFSLVDDVGVLKTGLYVKDQINGIGTLSYVDPETKVFGALGHEILEGSSFSRFKIDYGEIYKAEVSSIKKSVRGENGEKNANILYGDVEGEIYSNELEGVFGIYKNDFNKYEVLDVGNPFEIKKGKAMIKTVIKNSKIEDFDIEIISIDEASNNKNILFKITDSTLIEKTGGIVQGMSGSPIIQDNKIIGVVNYVIVDDTRMGYGIFITKMLEEGDKILS